MEESKFVTTHPDTPRVIGELLGETREKVAHPAHYGGKDDPYEHIKVCEAKGWGYHIGNITKYLWRAGIKDEATLIEDLEKARWLLDRYIGLLKSRTQR